MEGVRSSLLAASSLALRAARRASRALRGGAAGDGRSADSLSMEHCTSRMWGVRGVRMRAQGK